MTETVSRTGTKNRISSDYIITRSFLLCLGLIASIQSCDAFLIPRTAPDLRNRILNGRPKHSRSLTFQPLFGRRGKRGGSNGGNGKGKTKHSKKSRRGSSDPDSLDGKDLQNEKKKANIVQPQPSSTKRFVVSLERSGSSTSSSALSAETKEHIATIRVVTRQIQDRSWWEHEDNTNPYGGRHWPSALAVSQFLMDLQNVETGEYYISNTKGDSQFVLELGCGCGMASLVAAKLGATVLATDISKVVLSLTRAGWEDTLKQKEPKRKPQFSPVSSSSPASVPAQPSETGSLTTQVFDLFSKEPLPFPSSKASTTKRNENESSSPLNRTVTLPPIVLATAMMYEAALAKGLARRAWEAVTTSGAWVIIGDDDTGEREGGRSLFEAEWKRLEEQSDLPPTTFVRTKGIVKNQGLGWSEKQVQLLHLNPPKNVDISTKASDLSSPPLLAANIV